MPKAKHFIPEGYHSVTPYMIVNDARAAIEFYKKAFAAQEVFSVPTPDGKICHSEIKIGNSYIMLADEFNGMKSAKTLGESPVSLSIYVEDADYTVKRATEAGATLVRPVEDQFYGDRSGMVKDPFGYSWNLSTHLEDIDPDELTKRSEKAFAAK
jgi:PhnB protein